MLHAEMILSPREAEQLLTLLSKLRDDITRRGAYARRTHEATCAEAYAVAWRIAEESARTLDKLLDAVNTAMCKKEDNP